MNAIRKSVSEPSHSDTDLLAFKFVESHELKIDSIKKLCPHLPTENEVFFMWAATSFNAFTFIPYMIKECGCIENLIISTYGLNARIIDALCRYVDSGQIKQVSILISDSIKFRMPKVADLLKSVSDARNNFNICFAWNHSKVALIETTAGFFIVEGSGNWSENAKNEQYIFLNSRNVFDFRAKWILDEFNH